MVSIGESESMNALIYDIEIVNGVPYSGEQRTPGITYCEGWHDHANMGISVIGCYDYAEDRTRVFCGDNRQAFANLCKERDLLIGFNSIRFDNAVIGVTPDWGTIPEEKCYDLLREIWAAAGLGPEFDKTTHANYGLDAMCEANFNTRKTGHGALAPVLWQRGQIGEVIDYCLNDIKLTRQLFEQVITTGELKSPRGGMLRLRVPSV